VTGPDAAETHELLGSYFGRDYNARYAKAEAVARGFVPSAAYWDLAQPVNHLLQGPRGAGKTTLLKMLLPAALDAWGDEAAAEAKRIVDYAAVLVPTDRSWGEGLEGLGDTLDPQWRGVMQISAFTFHSLKALLDTAMRRADPALPNGHLSIRLERSDEIALCREVAKLWDLPEPASSLPMLRSALNERLNRIFEVVERARLTGDETPLFDLPGIGMELDRATLAFVEIFNELTRDRDRRWALMIDELELSSASVQNRIERMMRGTDPTLVIKVSIAPYLETQTAFNQPLTGMAGHDWTPVNLTYPSKTGADAFSRQLMSRRAEDRDIDVPMRTILGPSVFDGDRDDVRDVLDDDEIGASDVVLDGEGLDPTVEDGAGALDGDYPARALYMELADADTSFADYLNDKNIDLDHLDRLTAGQRAAWLRKPRGIVAVREFYLDEGGRRSRKTPLPFTGESAIVAMLEGNARWLQGLTDKLLNAWTSRGSRGMLPREEQARLVKGASDAYLNYLRILPHPGAKATAATFAPAALVERIATYFSRQALGPHFRPDPPTTFKVSSGLHPDIVASLRILIHAGAVIHIPSNPDDVPLGDLTGKRFRLTYLLAPNHPVPLRLSKSVALTTILESAGPSNQLQIDEGS
jgi:hypothetical protein